MRDAQWHSHASTWAIAMADAIVLPYCVAHDCRRTTVLTLIARYRNMLTCSMPYSPGSPQTQEPTRGLRPLCPTCKTGTTRLLLWGRVIMISKGCGVWSR